MPNWLVGTLLKSKMVADDVKSLTFSVEGWQAHKAGQHYDIRLTAESGYQAERSYSVASPPSQSGELEFGIQLLENGEVSPYLYAMDPGDQLELRGPIGEHFIWETKMDGPLVLIGGGSGMVPLMCMLRYRFDQRDNRKTVFLVSARDWGKVLYKDELAEAGERDQNLKVVMTLTEKQPEKWNGYTRRVDKEMLQEVLQGLEEPRIYICGPTPFVEAVANDLVEMGHEASRIKTERFGGA